ncbi:MAG: RNA polymerase sigma factor [Sphingomonadaceae bacterium]
MTTDHHPGRLAGEPALTADASQVYRRSLLRFFTRRTGDHAEAEDLTQEVLLRTARAGAIASAERPDAYIFTIAVNLLRDRAKARFARRADRHISLDAHLRADASGAPRNDIPAEDSSPELVLIEKERLTRALAALQQLPERTRDIFILFKVEKLRQAEIAETLGISVSAVEKHVVRAAAHLSRVR